jgi:prepilin-type N-terminal cleavage/methylation domain-containing protein
MTTRTRPGFTLIEVLMVVTIIVILTSMMFPMLSMMHRVTLKERTTFLEKKVDTALRLFKGEWGVYPCQSAYPDLVSGQTFASVPNHLAYRLGTDISAQPAGANVRQDMIAVGMLYNPQAPSPFTYNLTNTPAIKYNLMGIVLNRLASEQQAMGILAGNLDLRGQVVSDDTGHVYTDLSASRIVSAVGANPAPYNTIASAANPVEPGWAGNYLQGEIEAKYLDSTGTTILDAYRNPMVYICQAVPGMSLWAGFNYNDPTNPGAPNNLNYVGFFGASDYAWNGFTTSVLNPARWGVGALGFDPTTGPGPGLIASRPGLIYNGRVLLTTTDAGDGRSTPADAAYFPDPGNLLHSDVRYYAAPGYEAEFELWSAGPDGRFGYFRDDPANADNIANLPYNQVLANE